MKQVVIVGAGFGGLACAKALGRGAVDVLVVDRHNYHLFTPLLYQVASALVDASDIAYPVRTVFRRMPNVRCKVGEVVEADLERRCIRTAAGWTAQYDYLVIGTGTAPNFYGQEAIARSAHQLKELPQATALRNHVLSCFETAAATPDAAARRAWLTFVVAGGGPTGVEYAGALAELVRLVLVHDFRDLDMNAVRIVLVEGTSRVLSAFPERLGRYTTEHLRDKGVDVRLDRLVRGVEADRITLSDGEVIASRTLIWAAGVKASPLTTRPALPLRPSGRIEVDACLRVTGHEHVFAIGDAAAGDGGGEELPMLAPPAMQEGRYVARAISRLVEGRPLRPFRYRDKGILATIGRNAAVAKVGRLEVKGLLGWVTWLAVHLYYIIGFRNRVAVLVRYGWDYIFYDRPIRFINRAQRPSD